jgi:hypothetical protein
VIVADALDAELSIRQRYGASRRSLATPRFLVGRPLVLLSQKTTGTAAFSTSAVAKEFSSPRRQRGHRPYASCFSTCPLWPSGLVPGLLMRDSWNELQSMAAIS